MKQPSMRGHTMPVWRWPSAERTAWRKACQPADPFDPTIGRAAILKASTRLGYERGYGAWMNFLEQRGELDLGVDPGERVTEERLRAFLKDLQGRVAPYTQAHYLMGLSRVLSIMDPSGDYGWITTAAFRIHRAARPVSDVCGRLEPPEKVLQLGLDLMWEAEHGRFRLVHDKATLFRDGLMLALMVLRPLRIANFASITIGGHLRRCGERWWLSFPAEEMKTARQFKCPFPDDLIPALERYLEVHRKVLLAGNRTASIDSDRLWASRGKHGVLSATQLRVRIETVTREAFGQHIRPHDFRHLLASTFATHEPEGAAAVPTMLGHDDPETNEIYYNKAKQADAVLRYQAVVKKRRPRGGK